MKRAKGTVWSTRRDEIGALTADCRSVSRTIWMWMVRDWRVKTEPRLIQNIVLAVQEERGPRKQKKAPMMGSRPTEIEPPVTVADMTLTDDLHFQTLTQILIACLKQAKSNEHFRKFSPWQQNVILKNVWSECFILRASHWSIDIGFIIERCNDTNLKLIINDTKDLKADLIELSLLETLILCRKGNCCSIEARSMEFILRFF